MSKTRRRTPSSARTVRLLPPRTIRKGENIVARGAQARKGDKLLPAGSLDRRRADRARRVLRLDRAECLRQAARGYPLHRRRARPIRSTPGPSQIRNSSSAMLAAMVTAAGGDPWILPIARDTAKSLDAALARASAADLLLITGGVSAGKFDLVEPALIRAGARFHFTGVRIQPGKPLVFGETSRSPNAPNAESKTRTRQRSACLWSCPAIPFPPPSRSCSSPRQSSPRLPDAARDHLGPRFALARLTEDVKTKTGLTRFLPAACTFTGPIPEVALVPWQGSGDLAAMARANCFLVVPEDADRLRAGSPSAFCFPEERANGPKWVRHPSSPYRHVPPVGPAEFLIFRK